MYQRIIENLKRYSDLRVTATTDQLALVERLEEGATADGTFFGIFSSGTLQMPRG